MDRNSPKNWGGVGSIPLGFYYGSGSELFCMDVYKMYHNIDKCSPAAGYYLAISSFSHSLGAYYIMCN